MDTLVLFGKSILSGSIMIETLNWYYPKSVDEAGALLQKEGVALYAGGTGLLLRGLSNIEALVNLSGIPLQDIKIENEVITIGSMATYADVLSYLKNKAPTNILLKSLQYAANTPLRNRITIGGSIAYFPPWSDLVGPLLALDAKVLLAGENNGEFHIEEYLQKRQLRQNTLILEIKFKLSDWHSYYIRKVRTKNDLPIFTITLLLKLSEDKVVDSRIIIVGTEKKYQKLTDIEEYLDNTRIREIDTNKIEKMVDVRFARHQIQDFEAPAPVNQEYLNYVAGIELARGIRELIGK